MSRYIFDTDVIIEWLRNNNEVVEKIKELIQQKTLSDERYRACLTIKFSWGIFFLSQALNRSRGERQFHHL